MTKIRSLQDVRTLSGRVDQTFKPHKAFLRISCLEMEKARMDKEKESILLRLKSIEKRLEEMAAEKNTLLETVGKPREKSQRTSGVPEESAKCSELPGGFRLRY